MKQTSCSLSYVPELDGLRGAAIAAVVLYHFGFLRGGYIGVDVFFGLSGFLITTLLLKEHLATRRINLLSFYKRRMLRLFPALCALVVAAALYERFYAACPMGMTFLNRAYYALTYYSNWLAALGKLENLMCSFYGLWSLAIEEQFYLIWPPIVAYLLARRASPKPIAIFLC